MKSKKPNREKLLLLIKATAGSRREQVTKSGMGRLNICVREPAHGNRANSRILAIIRAMHPRHAVRMISGHHSPSKIVEII